MGKQFEREYIRICFLKSLKLDSEIFALKTIISRNSTPTNLVMQRKALILVRVFVCVCVFSGKLKFGIYF